MSAPATPPAPSWRIRRSCGVSELADQEKLWRLLKPEEIGVELTEEHMMDPEASVSALVFHHAQAEYFNASATK